MLDKWSDEALFTTGIKNHLLFLDVFWWSIIRISNHQEDGPYRSYTREALGDGCTHFMPTGEEQQRCVWKSHQSTQDMARRAVWRRVGGELENFETKIPSSSVPTPSLIHVCFSKELCLVRVFLSGFKWLIWNGAVPLFILGQLF